MKPEEIVEFAEALARISASGGGPKALAAYLARATNGSVLLEDAQWHHLAAAGSNNMPPSARGVVEAGAPGKALRVTSGETHLGWLSIFNVKAEGDLLLRLTAAAIGVELGREAVAPRAKRATFWSALLAGEDVSSADIVLAPHYCVVVLEAEAPGKSPAAVANELRTLAAGVFGSGDAELGLCEREQLLYVFVPAMRAVDASNVKTAAGLLPKTAARKKLEMRISGGVGTLEGVGSVMKSGATAQAAMAIGRRAFGAGHVVAYEDLGAYPLLYEGADAARLRAFAAEVLAPLRSYDAKHQTELERTLKIYFDVGQNIKTASERLNVHRHTIFYRLRQIAEITSRSFESPHDQLTLRLAVAVDELHA